MIGSDYRKNRKRGEVQDPVRIGHTTSLPYSHIGCHGPEKGRRMV